MGGRAVERDHDLPSRSGRAQPVSLWASHGGQDSKPPSPARGHPAVGCRRVIIDSPRRADSDLPRLPAARDRLERLQRRAGRGARAARPRGPSPLPGADARTSSASSTPSAAGRAASSWFAQVRRAAARGLAAPSTGPTSAACCRSTCTTTTRASRCARSTASATRSWTATSTRTCAAVRDVAEARRHRGRSRTTCVMGPAILARGARRRAVRRQDPRLGARVHGQAALPALRSIRQRGPRAGAGGAGRLAPHRREPVGGDAARGPARAHVPRARPASTCTRSPCATPTRRRPASTRLVRWLDTRRANRLRRRRRRGDRRALRPAPRPAARRRRSWPRCGPATTRVGIDVGAPDALAAIDPVRAAGRLLRRQADRLQGHRPAARRLAAGARARAATRSS